MVWNHTCQKKITQTSSLRFAAHTLRENNRVGRHINVQQYEHHQVIYVPGNIKTGSNEINFLTTQHMSRQSSCYWLMIVDRPGRKPICTNTETDTAATVMYNTCYEICSTYPIQTPQQPKANRHVKLIDSMSIHYIAEYIQACVKGDNRQALYEFSILPDKAIQQLHTSAINFQTWNFNSHCLHLLLKKFTACSDVRRKAWLEPWSKALNRMGWEAEGCIIYPAQVWIDLT